MDEKMTTKEWIHRELLTIPNFLTLGRILGTGFLIFYLIGHGLTPLTFFGVTSPWILPMLATGIVLTDLLDGFIARHFNCSSRLGGALDAIADKIFNWGIALTLVFTGLFPVTSLALLAPTIIRDFYVATVTSIDKTEDGTKKIQDKKKKQEKLTLKEKSEAFLKGDAMSPTVYGKLKMWPMSIAVISGLRFGYLLSQNYLFTACAVLADACSLVDIVTVHRNYSERKEKRIKKLDETTAMVEKEYGSLQKKNESTKKPTLEQQWLIEQEITYLTMQEPTQAYKAPYQKKH